MDTKNTTSINSKYLLKTNKRSSEEERVIKDTINYFFKEGLIHKEQINMAYEYASLKITSLKKGYENYGPDNREGEALVELLTRFNEGYNMTLFNRVGNKTFLYDTDNGAILNMNVASNKSFEGFLEDEGVLIEITAEIILILVSVFARVPGQAKKAVKDTAIKAVKDPRIRDLLKRLVKLLQNYAGNKAAREQLRALLSELMGSLTGLLKDLFKEIFNGLSWWDILKLILDLLLAFTPVGWLKKGAEFLGGLLGLTGSIVNKYNSYQNG